MAKEKKYRLALKYRMLIYIVNSLLCIFTALCLTLGIMEDRIPVFYAISLFLLGSFILFTTHQISVVFLIFVSGIVIVPLLFRYPFKILFKLLFHPWKIRVNKEGISWKFAIRYKWKWEDFKRGDIKKTERDFCYIKTTGKNPAKLSFDLLEEKEAQELNRTIMEFYTDKAQ